MAATHATADDSLTFHFLMDTTDPHAPRSPSLPKRLHLALMPDYNPRATAFWWTAVGGGTLALLYALASLASRPGMSWLQIGGAMLLAMLAGLFPVRVPGSKNSFVAGEIFIFLLLLMQGPLAATVAAAGEAAMGSFRTSKRWTSRIVSPAIAALSMLGAGSLLTWVVEHLSNFVRDDAAALLASSMGFAALYFVLTALGVAGVSRLKRDEPFFQWRGLFSVFRWVGFAYAGSAALATLLYLAYRQSGASVLMVMLPLLALLLVALHFYFRQQEADAALHAGGGTAVNHDAKITTRVAELVAQHFEQLQAAEREQQRLTEDGLRHLAYHDSLTGLPNRRRFLECLSGSVERCKADAAQAFAVMFLDFDRFKQINDKLGHRAGDELLVQLARRIQENLRPGDIVARLGGDEFAILVDRAAREHDTIALAERLMVALKLPFKLGHNDVIVSASIGITFSSFGYQTSEAVMHDADTAMYRAKGEGRAGYALFDASLHSAVSDRLRLEGELRQAIQSGQLAVVYQAQFDLASARLIGFEALVRWDHPVSGMMAPVAFLPIAAETGLMQQLSDFVLHCACRQLQQWQLSAKLADQGSSTAQAPLTMSINVSAAELTHPAFVARVGQAIVEAGLQPAQLTLELNEGTLMNSDAGAALAQLRALGVQLAVDDFGTGYSSLTQLSRLPIDCLKIDGTFVGQLQAGPDQAAIVRAIIQLGQTLHKTVIAEGIESAAQVALLREMGCDQGQGYHLATPMSAQDAGDLLQRQRPTLH